MTVRAAQAEDLDGLCAMARRFVAETDLPFTYSNEMTRQTFWSAIHSDASILLVWHSEDVMGGAVLGCIDQDFCNERLAYIAKFYIELEFRGLSPSRELLAAFQREAVAKGASIIFASATAGMGERVEKLYVRLFEHHGYNVLGRVLVKECT